MPDEIEAKMKLDDPAGVEAALRDAGAEAGPVIGEVNTFYDTADRRLLQRDEGVRIRIETRSDADAPVVRMTHKGPRRAGAVKTRRETELTVDDAAAAGALLEALGYKPTLRFEKHRRRFLLDGCRVELDNLPLIGPFVEIEGPDETTILAVRAKLGLDGLPLISDSYASMLAAHLESHGLPADAARF